MARGFPLTHTHVSGWVPIAQARLEPICDALVYLSYLFRGFGCRYSRLARLCKGHSAGEKD